MKGLEVHKLYSPAVISANRPQAVQTLKLIAPVAPPQDPSHSMGQVQPPRCAQPKGSCGHPPQWKPPAFVEQDTRQMCRRCSNLTLRIAVQ
eukprot:scaffold103001_cov16-Tisochrysis_lutea.AAC.2